MPGKIATYDEWLTARKALIEKEKELFRATNEIAAQLRELPMVKIDTEYTFRTGAGETLSLKDLFGDKKQLIVYHFMFDPAWADGCAGCSFMAEHFPPIAHLASKDTAFYAVSRASIEKIEAYKKRHGWTFPWVSSARGDFNHDFHVKQDECAEPEEAKKGSKDKEQPGISVFFLQDGEVFYTYSAYSVVKLLGTFTMLDMTPLGRQVDPITGPADFRRLGEYVEV
ncbi:hypothetical protein UCRPA7_8747 [Phaeoacremonium minimum UCRPA7]|uniref:Thioredoxin domain-containing protein n=1 Tax=Phaeoacremonium minimum (strain UCR-PA7) TaxID=1286976 RepID=R8B912_PHAM7|nr:hypothetical protein UCRPA7_8747 [Phaeoacremonium minimum UCRPA7]EON95772.1 hypothetical protein UCRPA7_8747 [Phaeoacremonium minimum UCRPA7]